MQVVFQDPYGSFNPRWKVEHLVAEPYHLLDAPPTGAARRATVEAALLNVGLEAEDADKYIHEFSGGQRQRIAIARVILKDAPILVLDEATSALDSEVEAEIQEQLRDLMQGKTVIAIAHRLSTIAAMDRLIVMDEGRIVESGTHEELLTRGGIYAQLWNRQSGGFLGLEETG